MMDTNIRAVLQWAAPRQQAPGSSGARQVLDGVLVEAVAHLPIRFFDVHGHLRTDATVFEPTLERFLMLSKCCDWPVVEYTDGTEVFFCHTHDDPMPIVRHQTTLFEVQRATRALMKAAPSALQSSAPGAVISVFGDSLPRVLGVEIGQLAVDA